jgi:hypothetical protein
VTRWLLVTVVTVVGAYSAYWIARPAGWSTAATAVFVAAVSALLVVILGGSIGLVPVFPYRRIARAGIESPARILEVWRTGATTHDAGEVRSEIKLRVEVVSPSGSRYRVRTRTLITAAEEAAYRPGATLVVSYHPDWPRKVVVTGIAPPDSADG